MAVFNLIQLNDLILDLKRNKENKRRRHFHFCSVLIIVIYGSNNHHHPHCISITCCLHLGAETSRIWGMRWDKNQFPMLVAFVHWIVQSSSEQDEPLLWFRTYNRLLFWLSWTWLLRKFKLSSQFLLVPVKSSFMVISLYKFINYDGISFEIF